MSKNSAEHFICSNKIAVMNVLAGLIKDPLLFKSDDFRFCIEDFPEQFHKIVFGAIEHLVSNGMEKIDYIDIDQFLKQYPTQHKVFEQNDGAGYISRIVKMYDDKKFNYYYQTIKKCSLINKLNILGIDTTEYYDPNEVDPIKINAMQNNFDNLSPEDIIDGIETKFIIAKEQFTSNSDLVENHAGDGAEKHKQSLKEVPEMGLPFLSNKLNTIYRGFRLGCLCMESSAQGVGKSRRQASESVHLAVPEYYDCMNKKWVSTGLQQNVLLISTELSLEETQTMWWSFVAGVPEDHILDGKYLPGEEERVDKAIALINNSNLYFASISNYDIDDIVNLIKKYMRTKKVSYVFYDYLSTTVKIMAEGARKTKVSGLREDQILLSFVSTLKDLAKKNKIGIFTATQLSGDWKNAKEPDQQLLRGAKAISDKGDCCSILLPVRECDQQVVDAYMDQKPFQYRPSHVICIYKVRRSHYNNIKLYIYFDKSTCQMRDCFVTDNTGKVLTVADTEIEVLLDENKTEELESTIFGFVANKNSGKNVSEISNNQTENTSDGNNSEELENISSGSNLDTDISEDDF